MDKFIENWHNDRKYRAKIKLLLYALFLMFMTIYALSLNKQNLANDNSKQEINDDIQSINETENYIIIPENYTYKISIVIDDNIYNYYGQKIKNEQTITKVVNDLKTEYKLIDNNYYIKDSNLYIKTTKNEVYDIINYNYINLETINTYLSKSIKDNDRYLIYLKDIILENSTNEYIVISINNNIINIDYTNLMKLTNNNLKKYEVNIEIENIE